MTTENIFAHDKYIGATVWLGVLECRILKINNLEYVLVYPVTDKENIITCSQDGTPLCTGLTGSLRLSWVKQDFVLGESPRHKLKPIEFKGVPVLAYVSNRNNADAPYKRWVIGIDMERYVIMIKNKGTQEFDPSLFSSISTIMRHLPMNSVRFTHMDYAWEIPG